MNDGSSDLISAIDLAKSFDGEAAFFARNLTTGEEIGYRADRLMPAASTIKLIVLAELFRRVDLGEIDLDESVRMIPADRRGGSGILKDLSRSLVLPVRDHATLMIALSDNTATSVLVRLLGREQILASARGWGMAQTTFGFESSLDRSGDPRDYSASTPREIAALLESVATGSIISPAACAQMREILLTQQYHDQIGRYLPWSQYRREGGPVVVRSKSGFMHGIRVDAGIVDVPGKQYVICTMTEGSPDLSFSAEHPGAILNGRISRLIFDAWRPEELANPG
jgi:beta-lactamase class A